MNIFQEIKTFVSAGKAAEQYGIKINSLYKLNKKSDNYIPEEGDVLKLR